MGPAILSFSSFLLYRDPAIPAFYNVRDFNKSKRVDSGSTKPPKQDSSDTAEPPQFKTITPQNYRGARASDVNNLIQGVVGNFVGITRAVRQHLLPEKQLLEVRKGERVCHILKGNCDAIINSESSTPRQLIYTCQP